MSSEIVFVALFLIATAVALAARWLKVPYTVALVVAGLGLGVTQAFRPPHLTKDLLYTIFLPGLLFEAAFHLDYKKFWRNKLAIASLAAPGLIVAIALTALVLTPVANALHFVSGFEYRHGLVFAALLAATDPIAVVGLFKSLGAPKRLAVLVEGESLLNDGTAVVVFTLILSAVVGGSFQLSHAAVDFLRVVGLGLGVGLAVGFLVSKLFQRIDDPMIEITLTTVAAYGSFALAEQFHLSGVIATVAAGMLCGNYGASTGMSPSTRIAVESFWEYVAFALNSVVFLLIGFEVRLAHLLESWRPILVAWFAVTACRAVVVAIVTTALSRSRERYPWKWASVLTWGGLRGGLSMVLALALPAEMPHRDLIVTMTFGAVILSILLQGLTMGPLLRKLGLSSARGERELYEQQRGTVLAARSALNTLGGLEKEKALEPAVADELRGLYQKRLTEAEDRMRALHIEDDLLRAEVHHYSARQLLLAEKDALLRALRTGSLSADVAEQLLRDVDHRLVELEDNPPGEGPHDD
ncbi:MAG: Na+/H+ antiporter [Polyangiales bacterium]